MDFKQSLQILSQLADVAQAKGILTLQDAVLVKQAKDIVQLSIQELDKDEPQNLEENGDK